MDVILVDENDEAVGAMEKIEAHQKALLHRSFSIFIFNGKSEMLLQKRALNKYHSAGLWSNACCGHPAPLEDTLSSATKRLQEEMGFSTELSPAFTFIYKTSFDNGLTEYEYDHVFIGKYDGEIAPSKDEVSDYCYKSITDINNSFNTHSQNYTSWFAIAFPKLEAWFKSNAITI